MHIFEILEKVKWLRRNRPLEHFWFTLNTVIVFITLLLLPFIVNSTLREFGGFLALITIGVSLVVAFALLFSGHQDDEDENAPYF